MNTETVTPKVKTGRKVKWPLLSLSVGESLTVPLCDGPAQKISPILSATARRNPEFRFKQKRTDGGFVITRVEVKPVEVKPEIASDDPHAAEVMEMHRNGLVTIK